jgi:hypothetical protein
MAEIESEWKRLQEHIRTMAENGTNDYVCVPSGSLQLEQVRLRAVAAGLRKYAVVFARLPSMNVSDDPDKVIWRLETRTAGGRFVWFVDQLGKTLVTEELAKMILARLDIYCADYEDELHF